MISQYFSVYTSVIFHTFILGHFYYVSVQMDSEKQCLSEY